LNLNSPASPGPSNPITPVNEDATVVESSGLSTPAEATVDAEPDISATTVNGKRKLRSSRTTDSSSKRSKLAQSSSASIAKDHTPPTARLSDLGGVEPCIEKLLELVAMPLWHPEVYLHTGVPPPRGVLLHGPPGCGKTLLAHAIAGVRLRGNFASDETKITLGIGRAIY